MPSDADRMETRLREWASWLTLGGTGDGYAAVNVLHPSWSPPMPGTRPSMKVGRSDAAHRALHAAVLRLSRRLQATLQVHYCRRLSIAEQALQLECGQSTVHTRVREAKRLLSADLGGG